MRVGRVGTDDGLEIGPGVRLELVVGEGEDVAVEGGEVEGGGHAVVSGRVES